jgi:hypothetical protein
VFVCLEQRGWFAVLLAQRAWQLLGLPWGVGGCGRRGVGPWATGRFARSALASATGCGPVLGEGLAVVASMTIGAGPPGRKSGEWWLRHNIIRSSPQVGEQRQFGTPHANCPARRSAGRRRGSRRPRRPASDRRRPCGGQASAHAASDEVGHAFHDQR